MTLRRQNNFKIKDTIAEYIPKEADITKIEFEGPTIAIYTKKPEILVAQSGIISDLVNLIKKRIVIRSDPVVRLSEVEAENVIREVIPKEADIKNVIFDPTVGEVSIEAWKPGIAIGKSGSNFQEIIYKTRWRPHVLRAPPQISKITSHVRNFLYSGSKERENILHNIGSRIFRPLIYEIGDLNLTMLGAAQEVGRSAILLRTRESQILLDCGINPGSTRNFCSYPRLEVPQFDIKSLDAVIISHAHLDHCGLVPFLFKYGYDGPVYCAAPTLSLMTLLQLDYLDVAKRQGNAIYFNQKDVRTSVLHTVPLSYGVVTDIAPDIRITLYNAGHILGSSIVHLHVGEGYHNIVYTGDFKYGNTMLLKSAYTDFPRVETIITEATYSGINDVMPPRRVTEKNLVSNINKVIQNNGKVLIPVPAVGRAQEIMIVIDEYMKKGELKEVPIFVEGMISEATAIHAAYPEYLSGELKKKILHDSNPFESDYFTHVEHPSAREEVIEGDSSIIIATAGMLEGGPIINYFQNLAGDDKNAIIFVSYQIEGTLGRRIQKGIPQVSIIDLDGKIKVIDCHLKVSTVNGFSGHSDRKQIINYLHKVSKKPEHIIINHGEKSKCIAFKNFLKKRYRINAHAPSILETIKLK